ncbi:hypothetical protein [Cyclobacterium salsum]|uniref:hypothetical protein n=1 Tax=Cyclobacterium salsum TaxID=2666329 RepID=UPI001391C0E6|nr:hypothetical protein [Cyclobacterium salsum]
MLKMLLKGVPVNYPPDISLNLIYENPFFFNDRIPSNHSLNFSLPATNHNLTLFNRPDRLNSFNSFKEYDGFEIYFGTVRILSGVLVVQEFERDIKCFFRGSVITDGMKSPLFQLPMTYYGFGTSTGSNNLFNSDFWASNYRELIWPTLFNNSDFCAPVMRLADEPWPYLNDPNDIPKNAGNFASLKQYINFFNAREENYVLFGSSSPVHTVVFPFPRARYIFEAFFDGRLDVNPFASGELQKIVLSSTYHPRYNESLLSIRRGILLDGYSSGGEAPDNFFYLNSFLPSLPANEMVRELLKLVAATMFPAGNGFSIRTNADILADTSLVNWDAKRINRLTISKREGQNYAYGYGQAVEGIEEFNGVEVDTVLDLFNYQVPSEGEIDVYVRDTKELWTKRLREKSDPQDPQRYLFDLKGTGLGAAPSEDQGGFDMKPNLEPVRMGIHEYWHEDSNSNGIELGSWYVPEFRGNRLARPERPQIGLFHGVRESFSTLTGSENSPNLYPLMTPHNYDAHGNRLGNLSLEWEGSDGLLSNFHSAYRDYIAADKRSIRGLFLLNALDLKNLNLSRKVYLRGMNFFIERINITIRQNKIEPAQVDLVQGDL